MKETILQFYGYVVYFYSMGLLLSYATMVTLAFIDLIKFTRTISNPYVWQYMKSSPYTPGVSIVAAAFNEEKTIVTNINSLLTQRYPVFEIVIVNDGSKDSTLELVTKEFDLVQVPYQYMERIPAKPFRALYRSTNPKFAQLTVVDKENGGTKADPINAGLNVATYPYFINTDVDCILSPDAIFECVRPMIENQNVIAVSGVMSISNGCKVENGKVLENKIAWRPAPMFQTLEYLRSFSIAKQGWSAINAMTNVSGGYGFFDRQVVINAGGYSADSFAEDMDMLIRMIGYCCDVGRPYRVIQIPRTCCWTEGPDNFSTLNKQRTRWGLGLMQTYGKYYPMMFRKKYRQLGLITLPYIAIFELIAPVIESVGFLTFVYLAFTGGVNWEACVIMLLMMYSFGLMISLVIVFYDYVFNRFYSGFMPYFQLILAAILEPFFYHPFIVVFQLRGYYRYLTNKKMVWVSLARRGAETKKEGTDASADAGAGGEATGGIAPEAPATPA